MTMMMTHRQSATAALLAVLFSGLAATADAQIQPQGAFQSFAASVRGNGIAFDSKNRVYLTVGTYGVLRGQFVTENGAPVGGTFNIPAAGDYTHFPSVSYSPEADGGAGAFLVVWHASDLAGQQTSVHARMVSYTRGGPYGGDLQIGTDQTWYEAPVNAAYSKVTQTFVVVWGNQAANVSAVILSKDGAPVSGVKPIAATGDGERWPGVACHETAAECLVSYSGWTNSSAFVRSVMVNPGTADINTATVAEHHRTSGIWQTDAAFNASTGQYVIGWYQEPGNGSYGIRVAAGTGSPIGSVVTYSTRFASKDAVDMAYNAVSGTTLLVSHDLVSTNNDGGVEIAGSGAPNSTSTVLVVPTTQGNFHPSVAPHATRAEWMAVTSHRFLALFAERITTSASSGGSTPPPPPPPPTTPPPTTPPPATPPTGEGARADFSGDGNSDILWQHPAQGYVAAWALQDSALLSSDLFSHRTTDPNWRLAGAGDFNGDGKPDVVWQHMVHGWVGVWYMNRLTLIDSVGFSVNRVIDTRWRIAGVGDFNSDGKPDLLWQHDTDRWLAVWLLDGVNLLPNGSVLLSPNKVYDARWKIAGVGDFNRDGKPDIVWRHSQSGDIGAWLMNGLSLIDSISFNPGTLSDPNWTIAGVIDVNRDNKPDLVWHHVTEGWVGVWYMNGNDLIDSVWLGPGRVADTNWNVRGPK